MTTITTHTPYPLATSHPIRETIAHLATALAGCVVMSVVAFWYLFVG